MQYLSRASLFLFALIAINPSILINEIAWMGTTNSANNEWIELYNQTNSPINFEGWTLKAIDGTPTIKLAGSFPANGFYLLERSKDYTGALNNKGEKLELYDNSGNLIDSADGLLGWPAGDNSTKQTMERKDAQNWQTSQNPGGTPGTKNSEVIEAWPQEGIKESAAIGESMPKNATSFHPIFIALAIAVFSAIMILILKRKSADHKKT